MKIIEVYKTNVTDIRQSIILLEELHKRFPGYLVNFDLHDCDKILRIESSQARINNESIVHLLREFGYFAEPLPD